MGHTAQLRLRIFEFSYCVSRITGEIPNVIVRWIGWSLIASQDGLCFVIKWRDYGFISLRVAAKQSGCLECFEIETIDEWTIAFRRRTCPGKEYVIARLHDRAGRAAATEASATTAAKTASAAVTTHYWRARILISSVLPAVPKFARLRAWLENPRAYMPRRAIGFTQERDALFCKRNVRIPPF